MISAPADVYGRAYLSLYVQQLRHTSPQLLPSLRCDYRQLLTRTAFISMFWL
jgi:hypothetical protein